MNYNSTPGTTGGFDIVRSTSDGYYNLSQGLPFFPGRSKIASIPEYSRSPYLLGNDLLMKIEEGKSQFAKILFEYAERNGRITKPDVKYRWRIEVVPHPRFYLAKQTIAPATSAKGWLSTIKLTDFTRPTQTYPTSTGNPAVVGNIARLQAGDFLLLMWSWLPKSRLGANTNKESYVNNTPEIAKIISVDYAANQIVVERNWAGSHRTATRSNTIATEVVDNSATTLTSTQVREKDAFFMVLPNTMPEDEIDQRVYNYTDTWGENIMQRSIRAWGGGHFADVINRNLGLGSPIAKSRERAIKDFYSQIELAAIFGEKAEGFMPDTGDWWGMTDGLLANIPTSHYIGLVPMRYGLIRSNSEYAWGSFDIPIFNKILEDKGYFGSSNKIMLCGNEAYTAFATMINYMTQNVQDIKSEWRVEGKRFRSSGGLTVDFIQSDVMALNGLNNKMIMIDPSAFRLVNLQNYPIDIVEVQNENPLKSNGFIHGVYSFMDLNPDAHWVFTIDSALADTTGATYANNVMGVPAE